MCMCVHLSEELRAQASHADVKIYENCVHLQIIMVMSAMIMRQSKQSASNHKRTHAHTHIRAHALANIHLEGEFNCKSTFSWHGNRGNKIANVKCCKFSG